MRRYGARSIARNAAYLAGARLFTSTVRAVYAVALAYLLGPALYGLFNYGLAWYLAFFSLTHLGIDAILGRELGRAAQDKAPLVWATLSLRVGAALLTAVLSVVLAWFTETDMTVRWLLTLMSVALVGRAVAVWAEAVFAGCEVSHQTLRQEAVFRLAEVATGVTVLVLGGELIALAAVHAGIWLLQAVRGVWLVRGQVTQSGMFRVQWSLCADVLRTGIPLGLAALFGVWLMQGPLVLFRHVGPGEAALGQLAIAMQAFFILFAFAHAFAASALPVLSRAVQRGDGKDRVFLETTLRVSLLSGFVAGLLGVDLGPWLVPLVVGHDYAEAGRLLGPAMWLLAPFTWAIVLHQVLMAHRAVAGAVVSALVAACVFTPAFPWAANALGAQGALLATGLGACVWAGAMLWFTRRWVTVEWSRCVLRPAAAITASLGVYLLTAVHWPYAALAASLVVLIAAVMVARVVSSDELAWLFAVVQRRMHGREMRR